MQLCNYTGGAVIIRNEGIVSRPWFGKEVMFLILNLLVFEAPAENPSEDHLESAMELVLGKMCRYPRVVYIRRVENLRLEGPTWEAVPVDQA